MNESGRQKLERRETERKRGGENKEWEGGKEGGRESEKEGWRRAAVAAVVSKPH